jgi:hypothetical protein
MGRDAVEVFVRVTGNGFFSSDGAAPAARSSRSRPEKATTWTGPSGRGEVRRRRDREAIPDGITDAAPMQEVRAD